MQIRLKCTHMRTACIMALAIGSALSCLADAPPPDEMMVAWLRQDGGVPRGKTEAEYRKECLSRRAKRLKDAAGFARRWAYCRHYVMGGSHYAYTEALSDAQNERTLPQPPALFHEG